jgi:alpha-glucosidase (family GH31 glycosyl hydrolase)
VLIEVGGAWIRGIRIVTVRYHVDVDRIPVLFRSKKSFELNDLDNYIAEVAARIREARR